jgi:alpha-tubulin suppressor-like RCC1 family protein
MTINTGRFELVLAQKLNSVDSSTTNLDLLMYARALEKIQSGTVSVVSTFSSLPSAALNLGKLYFVQDVEELYWSNAEYGWLSVHPGSVGTMWTWGSNYCGRLGTGTTTDRSSPGTTAGCGITWCQVSLGECHVSAVKTDGTLWTWGNNYCGRLGDDSSTDRSSPGTTAGGGSDWWQTSSGDVHTTATKITGTLWTWGLNTYGQLGNGTTTFYRSPRTTCGTGTTWCQLSAGLNHTAAVKTDGTLWTWGGNAVGQLGDSSTSNRCSPGSTAAVVNNRWCTVSAGNKVTAAIRIDGTLWTWGCNAVGQLGDSSTVSRSSPGTTSGGGANWCAVSTNIHTSGVKTDGTLWTWGLNDCGQLGDSAVTNRSSPGSVTGAGTTWCAVSVGVKQAAAVKTDGTLWTWGLNNCGQLGTDTIINRSSPGVTAGGGTTWCQSSTHFEMTAAIQARTF